MTVTEERNDAPASEPTKSDERISHRTPMQRWLISPEIGALIGAILVWIFFWGNGQTFGEADTTLNWLDVAAPTGIMATAIALLMIGGEFDLSSGIITGAAAIQIGLFSKHFMGDGVNIGWAILAALIAASAVGFINGFLVNRTGLPSFIITLASFFTLRGVMLVMSKRLDGKVQVADILQAKGAKGFKTWIAHEWKLTEFGARDKLFVGLVLAGAVVFAYALLEHSFVRRTGGLDSAGLAALAAGVAAAIVGAVGLLQTDGVGSNTVFSAIGFVGVVVAVAGLARARWVPRTGSSGRTLTQDTQLRLGLGVAAVALACLVHLPFDRGERRSLLTWISSGLRPVTAIVAGLIGAAVAVRAALPHVRAKASRRGWVGVVLLALYAGLLVGTAVIAVFQLMTVQAMRAVLITLLGGGGMALLLLARRGAGATSKLWQLAIGSLASVGLLLLALVIRGDSSAVRFRTGLFGAIVIGAAALMANTVLEYTMRKRDHAAPAADRFANRLQIAGGLLAIVGLAIRLLYSNLTPAHAAQVKAAGGTVGQNVLRETVLWWLLVAGIGAYVLTKTKWGNWIFATGGNKDAARATGVPVERVKIALFVVVSLCGALSGTLIALRYGTVQANSGLGLEFEFIIAAVVGGCLMTGGYGSVIGASLGAAILGISSIGVQTVKGWNSDGRFAFLGGVLLLAVLVNNFTRKKAQEAR